jgi:hypothetical protein
VHVCSEASSCGKPNIAEAERRCLLVIDLDQLMLAPGHFRPGEPLSPIIYRPL